MRSGPILLVEDSADDVTFVQMAFRTIGLDAGLVVADGGREAIEYLTATQDKSGICPLLMLLDLRMPGVNGFEVIRWVRADPRLKRLPIAVFSGSDFGMDIARAYELGANSYLVKPLRLEEFYRVIGVMSDFWLDWRCQLPSNGPVSI